MLFLRPWMKWFQTKVINTVCLLTLYNTYRSALWHPHTSLTFLWWSLKSSRWWSENNDRTFNLYWSIGNLFSCCISSLSNSILLMIQIYSMLRKYISDCLNIIAMDRDYLIGHLPCQFVKKLGFLIILYLMAL